MDTANTFATNSFSRRFKGGSHHRGWTDPQRTAAEAGWWRLSSRWSWFPVATVVVLACLGLPRVGVLPMVSTVTAACCATASAFCRPRKSAALIGGAVCAAAVSLVSTAIESGDTPDALAGWLLVETAFMLIALAQVARWAPSRLALPTGTLVFGAVLVSPVRIGPWSTSPVPIAEFVKPCCCWGVLGACALAVGLYLRSLDEASAWSIRAARQEQRSQLARDVHDWLAHEVTGIVLEAQAARLAVRNVEATGLALKRIEDSGVRALSSMDRAILLLRTAHDTGRPPDEQPHSLTELRDTVDRFANGSQASVRLLLEAGVEEARPETASTIHRIVLESLTNIRRHATSADIVDISVRRHGAELVVDVMDNAGEARRSRGTARPLGGRGLAGLAEQVDALGGTFGAGPVEPQGWRVHVVLPADL